MLEQLSLLKVGYVGIVQKRRSFVGVEATVEAGVQTVQILFASRHRCRNEIVGVLILSCAFIHRLAQTDSFHVFLLPFQ